MTRAERREVCKAIKGAMAAVEELMIEFVSKKRAANWGVINKGLIAAEAKLQELKDTP